MFKNDNITFTLKKKINEYLTDVFKNKNLCTKLKKDNSLVTDVDKYISNLFRITLENWIKKGVYFLSEEEDEHIVQFPMFALDPIDGTEGLVKNNGECCVSFCYLNSSNISDPLNFAWIYNPFTGFEASSDTVVDCGTYSFQKDFSVFNGLISRKEWESGAFESNHFSSNFIFSPIGSIALKLGFCSVGACHFVLSKKPKKLWDIAAGTILLNKIGLNFYSEGARKEEFNQLTYLPDLLWAPDQLHSIYCNSKLK